MRLFNIRRRDFLHLSAAAAAMTCGGDPADPTTADTSSTGDDSTTSGTTGAPDPTTTTDTNSTGDVSTTSGPTSTTSTTTEPDTSSTSTTGEPGTTTGESSTAGESSTTGEPDSTTTGEPDSTTTGGLDSTTTGESSDTGVVCTPEGVYTGLTAADLMVDACKMTNDPKLYVLRDAGGIYAMTNICTHQGCTVPCPVGGVMKCPCHGSMYNANGDVVMGPAPADLVHYLVSFECVGDEVKIYVDKSQILADRTTRLLPP